MNKLAKQLKLQNTSFDNPHGLANKYNVSSANDLAIATREFIKVAEFRDIITTKSYSGRLRNESGETVKILNWENTNVLLRQGYSGVKTGYTTDAGGCLIAMTAITYREYRKLCLIVVLGSPTQ